MIEDIGSMHGTYLNDVQLSSKNSTAIGNEDEVKFGAEVRRGPETFPACRFRVNYDFVPYKYVSESVCYPCLLVLTNVHRPANSYEFPEYSDLDDDDDDDEEDEDEGLEFSDEAGATGHTSSEDGVSFESPILNAAKVNVPIDLTRDDSPVRNNLIDLTVIIWTRLLPRLPSWVSCLDVLLISPKPQAIAISQCTLEIL